MIVEDCRTMDSNRTCLETLNQNSDNSGGPVVTSATSSNKSGVHPESLVVLWFRDSGWIHCAGGQTTHQLSWRPNGVSAIQTIGGAEVPPYFSFPRGLTVFQRCRVLDVTSSSSHTATLELRCPSIVLKV